MLLPRHHGTSRTEEPCLGLLARPKAAAQGSVSSCCPKGDCAQGLCPADCHGQPVSCSPGVPLAQALGHRLCVPQAVLWPEQPFPAQHTGCALESCQTSKPRLAMAIPHSQLSLAWQKVQDGSERSWRGRNSWGETMAGRWLWCLSAWGCPPLPLTLLCLGCCSGSSLGLMAEVALWLLLGLCIPLSGDQSPWRSLQSLISVTAGS